MHFLRTVDEKINLPIFLQPSFNISRPFLQIAAIDIPAVGMADKADDGRVVGGFWNSWQLGFARGGIPLGVVGSAIDRPGIEQYFRHIEALQHDICLMPVGVNKPVGMAEFHS